MGLSNSKYNLNNGLTAIGIPSVNVDGTGFMLNERVKYTANTGVALVRTANPNLDGTGTISLVLTAASNGTLIKSVTIKGLASNTKGIVRLFVKDASKTYLLIEIEIPYKVQTGTAQTFSKIVDLGFSLKSGNFLYASTQNAELISVIAEGLNWTY